MTNDTNAKTLAKFLAVLEFRQISRALVPVHADTLKEAEARADEIHADDVDQWKFAYDDVQVLEVRPVEDDAGGRWTMTNPKTPPSADNNTLKWFVATICREERSLAYIRIQANSLEEAEMKADEYSGNDIALDNWEIVHGDDWIESVEPDNGKQSHRFSLVVEQEADATTNDGGQDND